MATQTSPDISGAPSASYRLLRRLFLLAVVLWCAIPFSPRTVDSDFWGHVQYGWDTWRHGLDRQATYTYTAVGHPWINHENLSELIMAWGVHTWGPASVLAIKCVLGVLVLWLGIVWASRLRPPVQPAVLALVCVLVAVNSSFYWGLRPQVFTFFLFALLVALTEWCFQGWSGHWHWHRSASNDSSAPQLSVRRLHGLWLAPVLLAVWTNTHGGFLAGLGVYVALMTCRTAEVLWAQGRTGRRTAAYLLVLTVVGVLATLVNPYGLGLHEWLVDDLSVPRPEILEWHAPTWLNAAALKLWLLISLMAWGLIASRRPRDATQLVVLSLVLFEVYKHQRHIPFLAILCLFWLPAHLQSAFERLSAARTNSGRVSFTTPTIRLASVMLALLCVLFAYRVGHRLTGVSVSNYEYPVDALQFMADQGLTGRTVVQGNWAQYVLAVMGARSPEEPGITVAFDGRFRTCYPQHVADMHFDFFLGNGGPDKRYRSPDSPPVDPGRVLEYREPHLVLINRHDLHPVRVMRRAQDKWVLLYQDQIAQLWGRRAVYDQKGLASYFPESTRQIAISHPAITVAWPAAPEIRDTDTLLTTSLRAASQPQSRHAQ
jgi:hypothetical protein